jgi:DNA-binding ferritin-like protein
MTGTSKKNNNKKTNKKTRKNSPKKDIKQKLVVKFMELLNLVKLYHWKTKVYSQHKATDELHERLGENIDKFIEVLLGKDESRIRLVGKKIQLIDSLSESEFKAHIFEYRQFLTELDDVLDDRKDSDLLNIRDEMLADINQFLYLMTFE